MSSKHKTQNFFAKYKYWIIGLVLLGLLFGGLALQRSRNNTKPDYYNIQKSSLQKTITDSATLEPIDTRKVGAQQGSKINELLVKEGDSVNAGQLIARLEQNSRSTDVTTPINGVVTKINYKAGENTSQNELFQVSDISGFLLKTTVSASDINNIEIGNEVKVKIKALSSEKEYPATVKEIQKFSSLNSSNEYLANYNVLVSLTNKPEDALMGMKANLNIYGKKVENALIVENKRIFQKADGSKYLKLVDWVNKENNIFSKKDIKITTGLEADQYTEVLSGINEGDTIAMPNDNSQATINPFNRR
ncbi:MAG: efflux RND transporter periplasmic adaptor subunit [Patescibacteria group bacterium]